MRGERERARTCARKRKRAGSQHPRTWLLVPTENHLLRALHECYAENNGTQRYIMRCILDREEFMRFDSTVGEFRALTAMGRPWAESWNSQKEYMERRRAEVDTVCRHNYELNQGFTVKRRGEDREESKASSPGDSPGDRPGRRRWSLGGKGPGPDPAKQDTEVGDVKSLVMSGNQPAVRWREPGHGTIAGHCGGNGLPGPFSNSTGCAGDAMGTQASRTGVGGSAG